MGHKKFMFFITKFNIRVSWEYKYEVRFCNFKMVELIRRYKIMNIQGVPWPAMISFRVRGELWGRFKPSLHLGP